MQFFDWKLDFPEVLNPNLTNNKDGFDIVIGNPPYIGQKGNKNYSNHLKNPQNGKIFMSANKIFIIILSHKASN